MRTDFRFRPDSQTTILPNWGELNIQRSTGGFRSREARPDGAEGARPSQTGLLTTAGRVEGGPEKPGTMEGLIQPKP